MHKAFGTLMAIAVVAIVGTTAVEETACTPAQAAMVNQDVQAAAAILASRSPMSTTSSSRRPGRTTSWTAMLLSS